MISEDHVTLKFSFDHSKQLQFNRFSQRKQHISYFDCIFDQINAALMSRRDFFQKREASVCFVSVYDVCQ